MKTAHRQGILDIRKGIPGKLRRTLRVNIPANQIARKLFEIAKY